jgi:hypothetical protein
VLWVYDLRSLDLDWWAAAAPTELAATVAPGDRVVMLVGDAALAARERLAQALQRAGYPTCWSTIEQLAALVIEAIPGEPTPP